MVSLDEVNIAREIESQFGVALKVAVSSEAAVIDRLTSNERERFGELGSARRISWLKGRLALKRLLQRLGEDHETADIAFPNSRLSLTHSGDFAVAVGTDSTALSGIGVDLEVSRPVRLETARFFLTEFERDWLMSFEESLRPKLLLRLWTIKEALFKSDPHNSERWFADYAIENPAEPKGRSFVRGEQALEFRYSCFELEEGFLSVAILPRRQNDA